MDIITDPRLAGERLLTFAREGRLAQHTWHDEEHGRKVACLLGAAAGITDESQCPASLMPAWMAHALPALFDGQTKAHAMSFARRWGEAMLQPEWARIDWAAVKAEWLAFIVKQAKDAAADCADCAGFAADCVSYAADPAPYAAEVAARYASFAVSYAASATTATTAGCLARDAQADALMTCIERAMEVA